MNTMIKRVVFFDKTISVAVLLCVLIIVSIFITSVYTNEYNSKIDLLKNQIREIESLSREVVSLKGYVESKEKKIGLRKTSGVVSTLEEILSGVGLEAKVIKPLEKKKVEEYYEENAEIELQDADLNHIVNVLFKIENSPVPMKINNTAMKTSFEDSDKFILKLTVSLLTKG